MALDASAPIAVVTGATGGIGRWIALGLARAGYRLVLIARNDARGQSARHWIVNQVPQCVVEIVIADLSSLRETRAAGVEIAAHYPGIALLINNAGIFEAASVTTAEGYDRVLATNLLSPVVLTQALLPALRAPARIVNVGSSTSDSAHLDPDRLELGKGWTMVRAYGQSKLALMMVTFALANRLKGSGIMANVVHPGMVATGLIRTGGVIGLAWRFLGLFARSEEQGAETPLYAALSPDYAAVTGTYLKDRRAVPPNRQARDPALVQRVWDATERLVARTLS